MFLSDCTILLSTPPIVLGWTTAVGAYNLQRKLPSEAFNLLVPTLPAPFYVRFTAFRIYHL